MFRVFHSNRFEQLADKLADSLAERFPRESMRFADEKVVLVPALDIGDFLELHLASRKGAACNLMFRPLQRYITELLSAPTSDPSAGRGTLRLMTRSILLPTVLGLLRDDAFLDNPNLAGVRAYIEGDAADEEVSANDLFDPRDNRRFQLARQLATAFEEYTFSRQDMLDAWGRGDSYFSEAHAQRVEAWQSVLWRELTGGRAGIVRNAYTYLPLRHLFAQRHDQALAALGDGQAHLDLFGFAGLGGEFLKILRELAAEGVSVDLYLLNPTKAVAPGRPREAVAADLHPALRQWGTFGQKTLEQLDAAEFADDQPSFWTGVDEPHLLQQIQADVARGEPVDRRVVHPDRPDASEATSPIDDSLRVLACPTLKREVEVVANEIWNLVVHDRHLRFSDIAVTVPSSRAGDYLPVVEAVFKQFHDLPYNINSVSLAATPPMLEAVELLLKLPFTHFRRRDVLPLLLHPNVRGRFRDVDEETWVRWVRELGIHHSRDRDDLLCRYTSADVFNWAQGLRRLALGSTLAEPSIDGGAERALWGEKADNRYRPAPLSDGELDDAAALITLASSLLEDAVWLRNSEPRTLGEWVGIVRRLVDTYIVATNQDDSVDYGDQVALHGRVLEALDSLAERDDAGDKISYRLAFELVRDELSTLTGGGGRKLVGGVVVTSPAHTRMLPFEHVFMMGLGEGVFPTVDATNTLDLRRAAPEPGDILASERDKFHFLEILLAARRGLHLSWVAREATTGGELPPSSIISDLRRMWGIFGEEKTGEGDNRRKLKPHERFPLTTFYPLRRFDLSYFDELAPDATESIRRLPRNLHPEAHAEARMAALRRRIADQVGEWDPLAFRETLEQAGSKAASGLLWQSRLHTASDDRQQRRTATGADAKAGRVIRLNYRALVGFLKTPLQNIAKTGFGIYDGDDDVLAAAHEPFETSILQDAVVPRQVMHEALARRPVEGNFEELVLTAYDERAAFEQHGGAWPSGSFADAAPIKHRDMLAQWVYQLERLSDKFGFDIHTERPHFLEYSASCPRPRQDTGVHKLPAVTFRFDDVQDGPVEVLLEGMSSPITPDRRGLLSFLYREKAGPQRRFRESLRAYVDFLVATATCESLLAPRAYTTIIRSTDTDFRFNKASFQFPEITASQAKHTLRAMIRDIVIARKPTFLPHELVFAYLGCIKGDKPIDIPAELASNLADPYTTLYVEYGPLEELDRYSLPASPEDVIAERYRHHPAWLSPKDYA
jgi:exodeoxyribonuclease V gamma subunit